MCTRTIAVTATSSSGIVAHGVSPPDRRKTVSFLTYSFSLLCQQRYMLTQIRSFSLCCQFVLASLTNDPSKAGVRSDMGFTVVLGCS